MNHIMLALCCLYWCGGVRANDRLDEVLATLIAEAEQIAEEQASLPEHPKCAERFRMTISPETLVTLISTKRHQNAFVDAYVRWQLTSYEPDLETLHEPALFLELVRQMPPLLFNPAAEQSIVSTLRKADGRGPLSKADRQRLRELIRSMESRRDRARHLNQPALAFRRWILEHLEEGGPYAAMWLMETCAATIQAGWPPRSVKGKITSELKNAQKHDWTAQQRRMVAEMAQRLGGLSRRYVEGVSFMASGRITVVLSTGRVRDEDVERWIQRIAGIETARD